MPDFILHPTNPFEDTDPGPSPKYRDARMFWAWKKPWPVVEEIRAAKRRVYDAVDADFMAAMKRMFGDGA